MDSPATASPPNPPRRQNPRSGEIETQRPRPAAPCESAPTPLVGAMPHATSHLLRRRPPRRASSCSSPRRHHSYSARRWLWPWSLPRPRAWRRRGRSGERRRRSVSCGACESGSASAVRVARSCAPKKTSPGRRKRTWWDRGPACLLRSASPRVRLVRSFARSAIRVSWLLGRVSHWRLWIGSRSRSRSNQGCSRVPWWNGIYSRSRAPRVDRWDRNKVPWWNGGSPPTTRREW